MTMRGSVERPGVGLSISLTIAAVGMLSLLASCVEETTSEFSPSEVADAGGRADVTDVGTDTGADAAILDVPATEDTSSRPVDGGSDADLDRSMSGDDGLGGDADTGPDVADDTGSDPDAGDGDPGEVVRFVAFGDWGDSIANIQTAADAMWAHCQEAGCDFVIGLGDNFYEDGVEGTDDPQWVSKFEEPFADWDIPFYMTLGNHDYLGNEQAQVDYAQGDTLWHMPDRTYDLVAGPVHFFGLDTNRPDSEQANWLFEAIGQSESPWRIAFGHHPWRSAGVHGDSSSGLRVMQEWAFCDGLDLLLAGHDHDLQHWAAECGVEMVISGAVVQLRSVGDGERVLFSDSVRGFAWIEVSASRLRLEFWTLDGERLYVADRLAPQRHARCDADDYCAAGCTDDDPDCGGLDCGADGECEPLCSDDSDCYDNCPCDFNFGICEPIDNPSTQRCACDPQCRGDAIACGEDGHCDSWCPAGVDPDC